ncbi:NAD(P)/FAD-dependent oxidoreductase, partial [Methylocella tundrae]
MPKVVIIGAGIAGIPAAFELRDLLGRSADITVVSDRDYFQFVPSNPWVAVGWRRPEDIKISLPEVFANRRITFSSAGAKRVVPDENKILLGDETSLDYDYLVVATGPKLAFDEVEGLGPEGHAHSICAVDHAEAAAKRWEAFCRDPGPMVVGAVQGASCFGPAYEYALCAVSELRKRKIRDKAPMTFVTSEPYIGHLGLGGVGDTKGLLESVLRDRDIKWITNCKIERVTADGVEATEVNEDGSVKRTHKLASKFSMFLPSFRGVDCFRTADGGWIEGLTNPRGFILIDKHQRNPKYPNIFAAGVCAAIPPVEQTPVATGTP